MNKQKLFMKKQLLIINNMTSFTCGINSSLLLSSPFSGMFDTVTENNKQTITDIIHHIQT